MEITKAIIPVAGYGTGRLPITKAIEKCMLPVGNRPIIDYVVEDCLRAGIQEIFFIVNASHTQLEAYYSDNEALKRHLQDYGKEDLLHYAKRLDSVKIHYILQEDNGKYGTAIPVGLVTPYLRDGESVVVLMGDDFIYNADGSSEVARLISTTPQNGNSMLGVNVAREMVSRYGVLELDDNNNFVRIFEKPSVEEAPSTLINTGRYVFNHDLMKAIASYSDIEMTGEYKITEPINQYVYGGGSLKVVPAVGQHLDGGTVNGWLQANITLAKNNWRS